MFGYVENTIGRKATLVITTLMRAIACIPMATTPTYAQLGMTAAWIITLCRVYKALPLWVKLKHAFHYTARSASA